MATSPNPLDPSETFDLENGDLLFQDLAGDGLSQAVETVTPGFRNAEVSHVGVFVKIAGRDMVVEAFPPDVRLTPFEAFAGRALDDAGRPRAFVGRLKPRRTLPFG